MRPLARPVAEAAVVLSGWWYAGIVVAAAVALVFLVLSLRRAKVLGVPTAEKALRADAGVLAEQLEAWVQTSKDQAEAARRIATDILEGKQ